MNIYYAKCIHSGGSRRRRLGCARHGVLLNTGWTGKPSLGKVTVMHRSLTREAVRLADRWGCASRQRAERVDRPFTHSVNRKESRGEWEVVRAQARGRGKGYCEKVMGVKWGSVAVCTGPYESHGSSALDFTLSEERRKPSHGVSRSGL